MADSEEPKREEQPEDEGGAKRISRPRRSKRRFPQLPPIRLKPLKVIVILVVIILLLLFLIGYFGLGSGGGKILPGKGESLSSSSAKQETSKEPEKKTPPDSRPAVRRELHVSFFPASADPSSAQELACALSWIDETTGSREFRRIATDNMTDFEFELEKTIRLWRSSLGSASTRDLPVVSVLMTPFPGEGIFKKIDSIARRVDDQVSILRQETPETSEKP